MLGPRRRQPTGSTPSDSLPTTSRSTPGSCSSWAAGSTTADHQVGRDVSAAQAAEVSGGSTSARQHRGDGPAGEAGTDSVSRAMRSPVPDTPPRWGRGYLLGGLLLGGVLGWGRGGGPTLACGPLVPASAPAASGRPCTGVAGAIMVGLWAFTDHVVAAATRTCCRPLVRPGAWPVVLPFAARGGRSWPCGRRACWR